MSVAKNTMLSKKLIEDWREYQCRRKVKMENQPFPCLVLINNLPPLRSTASLNIIMVGEHRLEIRLTAMAGFPTVIPLFDVRGYNLELETLTITLTFREDLHQNPMVLEFLDAETLNNAGISLRIFLNEEQGP